MEALTKDLAAIHARWRPVEERAAEICRNIRRACSDRLPGESHNRANERHVEEFIARLSKEFPGRVYEIVRPPRSGRSDANTSAEGRRIWELARDRRDAPCVVVERQRLSRWAVRTTRWNFILTVPGESPEAFVLVAHYDTWRGPGADDNTTGEEIVKQYLLADLAADRRPKLTHTYFLAGSEECGLVGLLSQLLLAAGLNAAVLSVQQQSWWLAGIAFALCPLAGYRFGVSGSREYVRTLTTEEIRSIRAVISVDSVGEGRLYIPRSTMGADFLHSILPFGPYDAFTDVLEEGAHLHGIKYNNYLAGGTTDHVSFLEVNNGLLARLSDRFRRFGRAFGLRPGHPLPRIPASAIVTMQRGKASPVVLGGKIHTSRDLPERVHPEPLCEALLVTDYVFHILEGGTPIQEPRHLDEFHYARLYEITGAQVQEHWLALKDAIEPNQRNLNAVYRVNARLEVAEKTATVEVRETIGWGVDTRLTEDVVELASARGLSVRQLPMERLSVRRGEEMHDYVRRSKLARKPRWALDRTVARLERLMGRYAFLTILAAAYLLALLIGEALDFAFGRWSWFDAFFFRYPALAFPLVLAVHIGALLFLMVRLIPASIDNHYWHENRADNMGSLRRWQVSRRPD